MDKKMKIAKSVSNYGGDGTMPNDIKPKSFKTYKKILVDCFLTGNNVDCLNSNHNKQKEYSSISTVEKEIEEHITKTHLLNKGTIHRCNEYCLICKTIYITLNDNSPPTSFADRDENVIEVSSLPPYDNMKCLKIENCKLCKDL